MPSTPQCQPGAWWRGSAACTQGASLHAFSSLTTAGRYDGGGHVGCVWGGGVVEAVVCMFTRVQLSTASAWCGRGQRAACSSLHSGGIAPRLLIRSGRPLAGVLGEQSVYCSPQTFRVCLPPLCLRFHVVIAKHHIVQSEIHLPPSTCTALPRTIPAPPSPPCS
jgi:hypothetical protein